MLRRLQLRANERGHGPETTITIHRTITGMQEGSIIVILVPRRGLERGLLPIRRRTMKARTLRRLQLRANERGHGPETTITIHRTKTGIQKGPIIVILVPRRGLERGLLPIRRRTTKARTLRRLQLRADEACEGGLVSAYTIDPDGDSILRLEIEVEPVLERSDPQLCAVQARSGLKSAPPVPDYPIEPSIEQTLGVMTGCWKMMLTIQSNRKLNAKESRPSRLLQSAFQSPRWVPQCDHPPVRDIEDQTHPSWTRSRV